MDVPDALAGATSQNYLAGGVQNSMMGRKASGYESRIIPIVDPNDMSIAYDNPIYSEVDTPELAHPYTSEGSTCNGESNRNHATENIYN